MVGQLWELKDIAAHLGVTLRVAEHAMKREGIQPIARASRLRLYLRSQVDEAAAAVAKTRPYTMTTGNDDHAIPDIGHVSALGIALAAGIDEATAAQAIERAGVKVDHVDEIHNEPMFSVEDAKRVVAQIVADQVSDAA